MSPSSAASKPSSANSEITAPPRGFFAWFDRRLVPPLRRVAEAPALVAIREALPLSFSGLMLGLIYFGIATPAPTVLKRLSSAFLPSFGIMAAFLLIILSYKLAITLRLSRFALLTASFIAFGLMLPRPYPPNIAPFLGSVGASGLFLAIILALVAAAALNAAKHFAGSQWVGVLGVVAVTIVMFTANFSLARELTALLRPLAMLGDTYVALLVITLVQTLLWTAGIHGPALLAAVVTPVYLSLQAQNTMAYDHHTALPHIVVVSLFLFVFPGGSGATLPLVLLLLRSRVQRLRTLARLTITPALFNMNEPLLFGLPVVFNPFLSLPFVVAPLVLATITYLSVYFGFVARPAFYIPSSVPAFLSVYFATLDWRAVALICVNVLVATLIYIPFVRAYERSEGAV
ncbi:MAG: PTS transporter subunit EIIC [Candidatus Eremiobacteraeota bacterium]|nr:PTS transporter subunit EIIC [Candidatus Eremiobacteraeota bacterium]